MRRMKKSLSRQGYDVVSFRYSAKKEDIASIVKRLDDTIESECPDPSNKVNHVTHSLGGIILRCYLKEHKDERTGRVVMLSPPNRGSELVDAFRDFRIYQRFTGKPGQRLGTGTNDLPRALGPVDFELGVITGDRSLNPFYSSIVDGRDDGKVSIENAKVSGMTDFLVMHSSHTFIMRRKKVIKQVIFFLENGTFRRKEQTQKG
jgi:triacylglycerol lipase